MAESLATLIEHTQESFQEGKSLCKTPHYNRLGLTDSAIMELARQKMLVLTDDAELLAVLQRYKCKAISILRLDIR